MHHGTVEGASEQPARPVVRPEDMRAGDADRELVLDRLRHAHVEGRLDVTEFDERIAATLAARTYGELAVLTEDLPAPTTALAAAEDAGDGDGDFRSGVAAWAAASVTTTAIWAITCIASASWVFPWFLWVAGPWGAVLLLTYLGMRMQGRSPGR
jgi:Domain of unknown function (DUF1707)